jgi:hypothetical protein
MDSLDTYSKLQKEKYYFKSIWFRDISPKIIPFEVVHHLSNINLSNIKPSRFEVVLTNGTNATLVYDNNNEMEKALHEYEDYINRKTLSSLKQPDII